MGVNEFRYFCSMNLPKYIEVLLLEHDCVILPELGGFVVREEQAYVDDGQRFYPPYRSVGFNAQLKVNDGLLVQSIMQTCDTDYPEALRILSKQVDQVRQELNETGQWTVGNLGTLERNTDGLLQFVPSSQGGVASPEFYGLDAVDVRFESAVEPAVHVREQEDIVLQPVGNDPVADDEAEAADDRQPVRWGRRLMRYAAIFVGAVGLFFLTSTPVSDTAWQQEGKLTQANGAVYSFPVTSAFRNAYESFRKSVPTVSEDERPVVAENTTDSKAGQMAEEALVDATVQPEEEVQQAQAHYTIVLASMVMEKNAQILVDKLKHRGLEEGRLWQNETMLRVVYSSYDSENDAYNALRKLRQVSDEFSEAWVLKIN